MSSELDAVEVTKHYQFISSAKKLGITFYEQGNSQEVSEFRMEGNKSPVSIGSQYCQGRCFGHSVLHLWGEERKASKKGKFVP